MLHLANQEQFHQKTELKYSRLPPIERLPLITPSFATLWSTRDPKDIGAPVTFPNLTLPDNTRVSAILREMKHEFGNGYLFGVFTQHKRKIAPIGFATSYYYRGTKQLECSTWANGMSGYRKSLQPSDLLAFDAQQLSNGNNAITVDQEWQGRGIATLLYDLRMLTARQLECTQLKITGCNTDSEAVINKLGYPILPSTEDHDELLLSV